MLLFYYMSLAPCGILFLFFTHYMCLAHCELLLLLVKDSLMLTSCSLQNPSIFLYVTGALLDHDFAVFTLHAAQFLH